MRRATQLLVRLYGRVLTLYPRSYRQRHDTEMQCVFELTADRADRHGLLSLLKLCLRELWDLPGAIAYEHWRETRRNEEGSTMTEWPKNGRNRHDPKAPPNAAPGPWVDRPCSWGGTLAGLIPFLYIGLWSIMLDLLASPPPLWQLIAYVGPLIAGYGVLLAGLGVGWARGFPRWSYAYLFCVPLLSLYVSLAAYTMILPYAYVLCIPLFSALLPLAAVAVVVLAVTRLQPPVAPLFTHVWRDWTQLSFALYGLVPLLVWFAFDEVADGTTIRFMTALTLILSAGALVYLRSRRAWSRAAALLVGAALARVVATVGRWTTGPSFQWIGVMRASSTGVTLLLAVLFAPALLGVLRRLMSPPRTA